MGRTCTLWKDKEKLRRCKIALAAHQKIRWKAKVTIKSKNFSVFYSYTQENIFGTGLRVKKIMNI
jgi:hypothetical protein